MTLIGWAQIALVLAAVIAAAIPLGRYTAAVAEGRVRWLRPVEALFYRAGGIDPTAEQSWRAYAVAMVAVNAAGFLLLYAILRLQNILPLNPRGLDGLSPWLAFNTAVSFVANTNWQAYSGEVAMSYVSQMAGLAVQNFLSASTGIALALAVSRAFARGGLGSLGNFWADFTRVTLYVLLPLAVVMGLAFVALGIPQTFADYVTATTLEGGEQLIPLGPAAFQVAIKHLGTNGGGFFGVNSLHPFEGPGALVTALQIWGQQVIPFALCITFGRMVGDARQGRTLLLVMLGFVVVATAAIYAAEAAGNPIMAALGVDPAQGNMEGKDIRFGLALAALFTATTTGASCGAVNAMFSSFTPLGGMVPLFLMQLGEVLPGGVGSGLYGILVFALLAVFIAGLMVGRTPEYLGKKVQAREIKLAMLAVLVLPATILGFTAVSMVLPMATASLAHAGPHGLSEMLYAYTSAAGNNGSAFGGLTADTPWLNTTLGIAMLLGRFAYVVPVMAIAGSLAGKVKTPEGSGTLPTHGPLFAGLLAGIILILGGLQFLPSLALGPLAEHFVMLAGKTF
ncbi:potassium-transporting ATPase subunit KdpA [Pseudoroseomonas wenyumeiae]|uniref:Potassium-transporting ATPase potassium-binding subunit n=1 Tax=Teichococcus wenyumeiae TaxID=2478470 RepID=A0A3A9JIB7_9PROT|nr:potassium-transporting ATPase subunit KdpA [Pseudoroseomonas wenyumeiae]RKK03424.1 potassium-transporting ATPase subunit KdpA [Pseudoroseomonas wenyumeiae]RMI25133.1 potassium-transporting ATPase subunit KdpA [Pseudoroseomonas wenyumeiae]